MARDISFSLKTAIRACLFLVGVVNSWGSANAGNAPDGTFSIVRVSDDLVDVRLEAASWALWLTPLPTTGLNRSTAKYIDENKRVYLNETRATEWGKSCDTQSAATGTIVYELLNKRKLAYTGTTEPAINSLELACDDGVHRWSVTQNTPPSHVRFCSVTGDDTIAINVTAGNTGASAVGKIDVVCSEAVRTVRARISGTDGGPILKMDGGVAVLTEIQEGKGNSITVDVSGLYTLRPYFRVLDNGTAVNVVTGTAILTVDIL
ncbi:hypothetical protein ACRS9C_11470 [Serratia marcescens]|uniref:hypothetical protein n=1 Tax=Serratia marcescens TaxID=615 RepID=UPI003EDF3A3B